LPYKRRPPSRALQLLVGVGIDGLFGPLVRTMERRGRAERMFAGLHALQEKSYRKRNPFRDYVPGSQDVFVMTYAKSGTNWMMQIAHQLIHHGKGEYDHIHDLVPWPDTQAMPGFMKRYAIPLSEATGWQTAPEPRRVIKTHYNWDRLPHGDEARYIAVIRDPKDVFVSNYLFIRDGVYGPAMPSLDTWFHLYLSDDFMFGGSWAVSTAGYWAERHRPNVLVVSFKSMKGDLRGTVLKVAGFLDVHVSGDVIEEVCRRSSFEYMKRMDHRFRIGKIIPWRPEGAMIRKGTQGGSSELLSLEQQREMDAYFLAELKRLGSDFPYHDFCDVSLV
jgi:hypothetical protein